MPNIEIEPRSKGANRRRTYIYFCHFHNPKFKDISISNTPLWLAFLPHATIKPVIYQPYSFVTIFTSFLPLLLKTLVYFILTRAFGEANKFSIASNIWKSRSSPCYEYFVINRRSSQRKKWNQKTKKKTKKMKIKIYLPREYIGIHNIKFE